jgi:anti-sigma B factor antagonist
MRLPEDLLATSVSFAPSRVTIGVSSELDLCTAPGLHGKAAQAMSPDQSLIEDLADVTFIDSAGVEMLLLLAKLVRDADRALHLRRPSRSVGRLLEITGLTDALPVANDSAHYEGESV